MRRMSNRWDDLRREIIRKNDFETKMKLVKAIRREIARVDKTAIIKAMAVGYFDKKITALISCDYGDAILIKEALKDNKITKHFNIQFKQNETFPNYNSSTDAIKKIGDEKND
jgi:hypothetical protein